MENLGRLNTVALDKTGTLTTGHFAVSQIIGFGGTPEDEVMRIAAAVEDQSSHPLAEAIVKAAKVRGITFPAASDIENLAGKGIQARVEDTDVLVGALRAFAGDLAAEEGQELATAISKLEGDGQTTVIVRRAGKFIGVIALADEPRPRVREIMESLRAHGIDHLVMLTGDNKSVASRVATEIGITDVRAELMPGHKLDVVKELEKDRGVIAMIASGIGIIPLSLAVVLHEGSTIVVVLNALRLLAWHEPATT